MSKHVWQWDGKSDKPMIVVCVRCGQRKPLSEVLRKSAGQGCPGKAIQEELFGDETPK